MGAKYLVVGATRMIGIVSQKEILFHENVEEASTESSSISCFITPLLFY